MEFRDVLTMLRARWRTLLACVLLVLAATAWVTLRTVPVYQATARVFFSATPKDANTSGSYVITEQDLTTFVELMTSPVLRDPLRAAVGLPAGAALDVSARVVENAPMLDVTARSSSPQVATDLANAVGPQLAEVGAKYSTLLSTSGLLVSVTPIAPAETPLTPISPNVGRDFALGLLAGLALGVGVVILRQLMDSRVRSEADVKALSDRPLLGSLRRLKDDHAGSLVMEAEPHSLAAEEFRRLRTNLRFADVTTGGQHSFVVTSSVPGEGKTRTAVNLAMAMADTGARVLLVDADLRNPSVAERLGLEGAVGLTTILLEQATPDEVAQRWGVTSLYVLPAGTIPPNPSELLGSGASQRLFERFCNDYDFVLVDSPPLVPVIDAMLINEYVGGLLMVVSVDQTRKRDLGNALKALKTVNAAAAGFALNMVRPGEGSGYYGYPYVHPSREGRGKRSAKAERSAKGRSPVASGAAPALPAAANGDPTAPGDAGDDGRRFAT